MAERSGTWAYISDDVYEDDNDDENLGTSNSENSEESESLDDSHLRVKRTGRLGPPNKQHLRDRTIYRKSLFITNPIDPADQNLKPEELVFKGINLNRWEQVKKDVAILEGRRISAPPTLVPELVQDLLAGKQLRKVNAGLYALKKQWLLNFGEGNVTEHNFGYQWTVLKSEYNQNSARAVLNQMSRILEVFPVRPKEIPKVNMRWLLDVGKALTMEVNPQIRPRMERPRHVIRTGGKVDRAQYKVPVKGFDPNETEDSRAWIFHVSITVGTISAETSLPELAHGDRIDWTRTGGGRGSVVTEHPSDPEYRLAQLVASRYTGSIGDIDTVRYKCKLFISLYTSQKWVQHHGWGIYRGCSIWESPHPYRAVRSILPSSKAVKEDLTVRLPAIQIFSLNKERWVPPLEAMLQDFVDDVTETWHMGCAVADIMNDEISQMLPPQMPSICNSVDDTDRQSHYHLCILCFRQWLCFVFEFTHLSTQYKLCRACRTTLTDTDLIAFDLAPGRCDTLLDMLHLHLRKENRTSRQNLSDAAVKILRDECFAELKADYEKEPGAWHDYVIKQVLREDAEKYLTWTGIMLNAMQPSIEATNPAPINPETGETGYHIRGNLGIMSWSMNLVLRHHPKVLVKSLYLLRNGTTTQQHETARILILNLLINEVENNTHHVQQTRRIGNPPPTNMQEVEACWKSGQRFSEPIVPKDRILRYCTASQNVRDIDPSHEPNGWEILMKQLRLAAQQEGLGPAHEQYWLKDNVPYFFDPSGLSPGRWRPWDVMNFFSHKLYRLRNLCDRLYAKKEDRPKFEVVDLILVVAHLHMRMVKVAQQAGERWPGQPLIGVDEARLPVWCVFGTVLTSSIGHKKHGYEMRSGLTYDGNGDHVFNFDECNLAWQAQATNMGMMNFNEIQYAAIFEQFDKPRLDPEDFVAQPPYEPGLPHFAETWIRAQDWEVHKRPGGYAASEEEDEDVFDAFDITFRVQADHRGQDPEIELAAGDDDDENLKTASRKKPTKKTRKVSTSVSLSNPLSAGKLASKKSMKKATGATSATMFAAETGTDKATAGKPATASTTKPKADKPAIKKLAAKPDTKMPASVVSASSKPASAKTVSKKDSDISATADRARALYLQSRSTQLSTTTASRSPGRHPKPGPHFNMTNTTNTCYISSTLQHFSKVDGLRDIFRGPADLRVITGRPDNVLPNQYRDPSGSKLVNLYEAAQQVFHGLEQTPGQLPGDFTDLFFRALNNLNGRWVMGAFDDARDLFEYFVDAMVCVTDRSDNLNLGRRIVEGKVVFDKNPEAKLLARHHEDVAQAEDLPSFSEFSRKCWQAHRRCGHESPLSDLLTIQTVDELTCNSQYCEAKAWEPEYSFMLRLNIPQGAESHETYSPTQLEGFPKPLTLTTLDPPRTCWRCSNKSNIAVTDGKFATVHTKVVRVPPLLAVHVGRTRLFSKETTAPEGTELANEAKVAAFRAEVTSMLGEAETSSFENKMVDMELLDLSDLNVQPEDLIRDVNSDASLLYDLIGIWLHSKTRQHWVACIRDGKHNDGRFVRYDDKQMLTEYINLSEVQQGDWTVAMLFYKQRKEDELPPVPGDVPVPTNEEVAQAVEIVLSSDHAVLVEDEPIAAMVGNSADSREQSPTEKEDELSGDPEWAVLPDGTHRHRPTLKVVVDEYRVRLAAKKMQLDQEYDVQLAMAKKELEAEFASKVEAAVRAKTVELDNAQKKLAEDRRHVEAERQRLKETRPQQQVPAILPLEQLAAALERVPTGSTFEAMDLANRTLIKRFQDQLVSSQKMTLPSGALPAPMTADIKNDHIDRTRKISQPVARRTDADSVPSPNPMEHQRRSDISAQEAFVEADVALPILKKDDSPPKARKQADVERKEDYPRTPRASKHPQPPQSRPEPRRTDYKSPMHPGEEARRIFDAKDPFESPSPKKVGPAWLNPPQSSPGHDSGLSPEFGDLSVETESARKRQRSPGLHTDSPEHRSRKLRPANLEASPGSRSKVGRFITKTTRVGGELLHHFKDPSKGNPRTIGSQLKLPRTGLNLKSIKDRSRLPIKAATSSGGGAISPFPTSSTQLLPTSAQAPKPPTAFAGVDISSQGAPSPSGGGAPSPIAGGAPPIGRGSLRLPRSPLPTAPTGSMRSRAPYPQPLNIINHRVVEGEFEYRVSYHGSTSWVPEHRLRKEAADMLEQYKVVAGLWSDSY